MTGKKRSPKYPFISLEKAIERANELYIKDGMNTVGTAVAKDHWGYNPKSSGGLQTIGALNIYGLLESVGKGFDRKVKLTQLARRILLDKRETSPDRDKAIKEAALNPTIFLELYAKWQETGPQSDESLEHDLVFERNFNEKSVKDFIRIFKDTMLFAKLDGSATLSDEGSDMQDEDLACEVEKTVIPPIQSKIGMRQDIFTLDEGQVVLQYPSTMSPDSFEDFEAWVELIVRKTKRNLQSDNKVDIEEEDN